VKSIARLHGGRIDLETSGLEAGAAWRGNRFTLVLPRAEERP